MMHAGIRDPGSVVRDLRETGAIKSTVGRAKSRRVIVRRMESVSLNPSTTVGGIGHPFWGFEWRRGTSSNGVRTYQKPPCSCSIPSSTLPEPPP